MRIYLSYRIEDSFSLSEQVKIKAVERFGRNSIVMDVANRVPIGMSITGHIRDTVAYCKLVIVLIGPEWAINSETGKNRFDSMSDPVRMEVEAALRHNVRVVPVLIKGATMPPRKLLPESMQDLYKFTPQLIEPDHVEDDIDKLLRQNGQSFLSSVNMGRLRKIAGPFVVALVVGGILFAAWFARYQNQRLPDDFLAAPLWSGTVQELEPVAYYYGEASKFAFQPYNSQIAIITHQDELNIWNYRTGTVNVPGANYRDLAFYPNGASVLLLPRTYYGALFTYTMDTASTRAVFQGANWSDGMVLNRSASALATWTIGTVTVWNTKSERMRFTVDVHDTIVEAAFTGDSDGLWVLGRAGLYLWDLTPETASLKASYTCEACRFYDIVVDPDKDIVYILQSESRMQLGVWDGQTETPAIVLDSFSGSTMNLSPDGSMIVFADSTRISMWDTESWQRIANILTGNRESVMEIHLSPGGHFLATRSYGGTITLWGVNYNN